MKTMLVAINAKYIHSNPAIYCLKSYSGSYGEDIILGEYTINNLIDHIVDDIYEKKPDFIGFSTYIWNVEYVMKAACELRKLLPDCKMWFGGPEVTYNAVFLMKKYSFIDGIMCGEGEDIFLNVLKYYKGDLTKLQEIKGIVFRDEEGNIRDNSSDTNGNYCSIKNINMSDIPFIYNNVENFENRIIYYESSRGCPFSCSYCLSSVDKTIRFRDINLVIKELGIFLEKKVKQVKFVDRTFNCKKSHAMTILKYIGEHDNGVTNFHFEVAADLMDDDEIALIKTFRPGLIQLEIGIQSVNDRTITEINRKMNLDKVKYVVSEINKGKNVLQHLDIIAGLPYEGLEDFKRSFNETYAMRPAELQLGFLKVLSGSVMKEKAEEYGLVYRDYPPYEVLYTKWITHDEICELKEVEEALEVYYNSMQYKNTMTYMETFFHNPYEMYREISLYYKNKKNIKGSQYSRQDRYNILYNFFESICSDEKSRHIMAQIMTYDIYLRENAKKRPFFAGDTKKDKKSLYELYRVADKNRNEKYIHLEHFDIDILRYSNENVIEYRDMYLMFDYSVRNPINNDALVTEIKKEPII